MCGIAGYIPADGAPPQREIVKRMCDRLIHRGPDAEGYYVDDHVALGHRRLSIIDLSTGDQPMGNEDGTLQVVFNGEIYNYQELRADLKKRGHCFRTNSDTEVLLHLYEDVGERTPEYLNGMFAFAIWDARNQELFLARDRFGKKPLYYSLEVPGMRCCFGSELKALTALPGFPDRVNERAVADFLCLSYIPDPETIYQGASKLAPAHTLTITSLGHSQRRYWRPVFSCSATPDFDDTLDEIRSLGADAVKRRMISDVPLGAFLSGGVDSSAVVALMAEQAATRVKTFTIGFSNRKFDETSYARIVAERFSTDHHEQTVSPSSDEILPTLFAHYDEPFGDSSAIPSLHLARTTRQYVTVALSGDGADELFGGYRRYRFGVLEEQVRQKFPGLFRRTVFKFAGRVYPKFDYLPQVFRAKSLLSNLSHEIGDAYFTSMTAFRDESLDNILAPETRRGLGGYSVRRCYRNRFDGVRQLDPLQQMQAVDLETYLPGDILVKADRATMAYSLESRSPWLDYRLAEVACRLPTDFKLQRHTGKHVFKQAIGPKLPRELIVRKKMGFSVPLAEWFRTALTGTFQGQVLRPDMERYLSLTEARRIWAEHRSGMHDHSRKLWNLLVLASWDSFHARGSCNTQLAENMAL